MWNETRKSSSLYGIYVCILGSSLSILFCFNLFGDDMKRTTVKLANFVLYNELRKSTKKKFYNLLDEFLEKHDYNPDKIIEAIETYLRRERGIWYAQTITITLPALYIKFLKNLAIKANTTLSDIIDAIIHKIYYDLEHEKLTM